MAGLSLAALSLGLPAFALVKVVAPAFYARQDTKTPVRAAVVAMIANMVMNLLFVGLLFVLWRKPDDSANGVLDAIARVPGLHMGLALASTLASYLNLWQLWNALRREGIYARQPGWGAHLLRLGLACAALVVVLAVGMYIWPDWSTWPAATRAWRLVGLIAAAGGSFATVLFAAGFRLRDLRGR
jgi:putative peptidoglycan lipid II flippase